MLSMPTPADAPTISGSGASVASFSFAKLVFSQALSVGAARIPEGFHAPGPVAHLRPRSRPRLLDGLPSD
jgi:hypothetical protein